MPVDGQPVGILNDEERRVTVYFEGDFRDWLMGIHPNENTVIVYMKTADVLRPIEADGNELKFACF